MSANSTGKQTHAVPIIAIGASAGGLEAATALLKALPADMKSALVLILHLDPSHDSMMVALLARDTRLTVVLAADGMAVQPAHLYVIPPGVFLTVRGGVLRTAPPESGKPVRLPFDVFLRSLALEAPSPMGCIVLSGTGTDGSGGLADVRRAGGLILAQDPREAGHSGMPDSAIATGLVDHVLKIADMPAVLGALTSGLRGAPGRGRAPPPPPRAP
ncbi:MAG: chemotaxis protein CheB, partial [Oceanicaulis sp.]|nr:chemotaxis protein CheB [Oceanicaulis sp.]